MPCFVVKLDKNQCRDSASLSSEQTLLVVPVLQRLQADCAHRVKTVNCVRPCRWSMRDPGSSKCLDTVYNELEDADSFNVKRSA